MKPGLWNCADKKRCFNNKEASNVYTYTSQETGIHLNSHHIHWEMIDCQALQQSCFTAKLSV